MVEYLEQQHNNKEKNIQMNKNNLEKAEIITWNKECYVKSNGFYYLITFNKRSEY